MALTMTLYRFSKKVNSTEQPTISTQQQEFTSVLFKEGTSMLTPTIILNLGLTTLPFVPNYAHIPFFGRYYYISNLTYDKGRWFVELEVDPLASWKTEIGLENCYVLRSSVAYDGTVVDTMYPTNVATTTALSYDTSIEWATSDLALGTYVLGIAGQSTTYYRLNQSALDDLFDYLFSDLYLDDVVDDWANVFPELKSQLNPLQYITSIMWLPFATTGFTTQTIRIGYVDVSVSCRKVDGNAQRAFIGSFSPSNHPQASRGSYLNSEPYARTTLFYPPFGMFNLDSNLIANASTLTTQCTVDMRTGMATLEVYKDSFFRMSRLHSQVGVNYQVSQVVNKGYGLGNLINDAATIGVGAVSAFMTGNPAGAIVGATSAIKDFASSKIPSATTIGSNGSIDALLGTPTLQQEFANIVDENNSNRGRPLCENRTINTLGGYILVADADVSIPATEAELKQIQDYMEGGFFYE